MTLSKTNQMIKLYRHHVDRMGFFLVGSGVSLGITLFALFWGTDAHFYTSILIGIICSLSVGYHDKKADTLKPIIENSLREHVRKILWKQ